MSALLWLGVQVDMLLIRLSGQLRIQLCKESSDLFYSVRKVGVGAQQKWVQRSHGAFEIPFKAARQI